MLSAIFQNKINQGKKLFALLIDPDKYKSQAFTELLSELKNCLPDLVLVGGSLLFSDIHDTIKSIKSVSSIPVYIFPGNAMHVSAEADGVLFTTLISGRNPEFLIGNQVNAAPIIKKYQLDTLATGYILIESNNNTAVRYMSNTMPIPRDKAEIAVATAIAGQMLGLQAIYLEAGSGANEPVPLTMISAVKKQLNIALIVGGGLRTPEAIKDVYQAGADMVVIGNAFEKPENLPLFAAMFNRFI